MNFKYMSMVAIAASAAMSFTACDDDDENDPVSTTDYVNAECTTANVKSWGNYMIAVANLLASDASTLQNQWTSSYAAFFKAQDALVSAEEIVDGCSDIANEVGEAKIGDPLSLYESGETEKALFAVESWYSWHSRDDYRNNIFSVRNSYYCSLDGTVDNVSLKEAVKAVDAELDAKVESAIAKAAQAIYAIPQPFRNNINSAEAKAAQVACNELAELLGGELKNSLEKIDKLVLDAVVANYVDNVVLPTYANLKERNAALLTAVKAFAANPSDEAFVSCANAWLSAREPWETSEAFLFGPVADLGLDPNMDSWPLDQKGICNILTSGKYEELNWDGDYDEESESIASAQSLRGFHTLEYLIFKEGQARTIKSL